MLQLTNNNNPTFTSGNQTSDTLLSRIPHDLPAEDVINQSLRTYIDELKTEHISAPLMGNSTVVGLINKTKQECEAMDTGNFTDYRSWFLSSIYHRIKDSRFTSASGPDNAIEATLVTKISGNVVGSSSNMTSFMPFQEKVVEAIIKTGNDPSTSLGIIADSFISTPEIRQWINSAIGETFLPLVCYPLWERVDAATLQLFESCLVPDCQASLGHCVLTASSIYKCYRTLKNGEQIITQISSNLGLLDPTMLRDLVIVPRLRPLITESIAAIDPTGASSALLLSYGAALGGMGTIGIIYMARSSHMPASHERDLGDFVGDGVRLTTTTLGRLFDL